MFDTAAIEALSESVRALSAQPLALADGAQTRALLRTLQAEIDRLEGLKAAALDQLEETGAYADDGASSSLGWARRELRLSAGDIKRRRAAGRSMRLLPDLGEAVRAGEIRVEHAYEFTAGLTKVGLAVMATATPNILLPLARVASPKDVAKAVRHLDKRVHPERLEDNFRDGMTKHDVTVTPCGDGFHLVGFLDIANGAKLETWLTAASAPRDLDDARTAAQRRVDAFGGLVDATLKHGMPSDRGARPQLHVTVDARWLAGDADGGPTLAGFGPIGDELFGYLACDADLTTILVDGFTDGPTPQADVLNVGRTTRLATRRQRTAVTARQEGSCAAPGCRHTIAEVHHVSWWARDGGRTDLDELVGLCGRCHVSIHTARLHVERDGRRGFVFRRGGADGPVLEDHERVNRRRLAGYLRALGTIVAPTPAPSPAPVTAHDTAVRRHVITPRT